MKQLGIEHIAAYSPEARGRSERLFRTLQDRLPKELRLAGISTIEAANAWLRDHYIAEHNGLFATAPEEEGSAFVADRTGAWRDILCTLEERVVGNDNTLAWGGRRLQLPQSRLRPHFVRAKVKVRCYPDGTLASIWDRTGWRATPVRASSSSLPRPHPVWQRARRRQGVAWKRQSQAQGRRDGQP